MKSIHELEGWIMVRFKAGTKQKKGCNEMDIYSSEMFQRPLDIIGNLFVGMRMNSYEKIGQEERK